MNRTEKLQKEIKATSNVIIHGRISEILQAELKGRQDAIIQIRGWLEYWHKPSLCPKFYKDFDKKFKVR
jgi:hypothetical protein